MTTYLENNAMYHDGKVQTDLHPDRQPGKDDFCAILVFCIACKDILKLICQSLAIPPSVPIHLFKIIVFSSGTADFASTTVSTRAHRLRPV